MCVKSAFIAVSPGQQSKSPTPFIFQVDLVDVSAVSLIQNRKSDEQRRRKRNCREGAERAVGTDKPGRDGRETSGLSTRRPSESARTRGLADCNKLHKGSRRSRGRRAEHLRSDLLITCLQ